MTASVEDLARAVVADLTAAGRTVAVAESLTGGAVCDALVAVPGASACLRGGVVAYATDVKATVLGVDAGLLAREGAVHEDVARQMAEGVRALLSADVGVATTGVAGPDPQDGAAPGSFHVAVADADGTAVRSARPDGPATPPRAEVRRAACRAALDLLAARTGTEASGTADPGGALHPL